MERFSKEGYLEETTKFPSHTLTYALKAKSGIHDMEADYYGNKITVFFPDEEKESWHNSERISYKNSVDLPGGRLLCILLEKDFVCLDHSEEDQSDNYTNPGAVCSSDNK